MKSTKTTIKTLIVLTLIFTGFTWLSISRATDDIRVRSYDISTGGMKTDMQRMVEAYEKLSDQYLSLVQQQLGNMDMADRQIIQKLDKLERRLENLDTKVDLLINAIAPAQQVSTLETPKQIPVQKTSEKKDSAWTQQFMREQGLK